jgi:hypothetical protein
VCPQPCYRGCNSRIHPTIDAMIGLSGRSSMQVRVPCSLSKWDIARRLPRFVDFQFYRPKDGEYRYQPTPSRSTQWL